jgi:hypothetical protein
MPVTAPPLAPYPPKPGVPLEPGAPPPSDGLEPSPTPPWSGPVGPMGPAGPVGPQGPTGADSSVPGPQGPQGIQGPQGTTGTTGPAGATGPTGAVAVVQTTQAAYDAIPSPDPTTLYVITDAADRTVLAGAGAPSGALGIDGDFYINTTAWLVYGPKAGTWPAGVSMVGPAGAAGAAGATGTQGATGPQGAAGPQGSTGPQGPTGADSTVPGPTGPQGATGPSGFSWETAATLGALPSSGNWAGRTFRVTAGIGIQVMVWNGAAWIVDTNADTGWLNIGARIANSWTLGPGGFYIRRIGNQVGHQYDLTVPVTWNAVVSLVVPPGFTPRGLSITYAFSESGTPRAGTTMTFSNSQTLWTRALGTTVASGRILGELWTTTTDAWPTVTP